MNLFTADTHGADLAQRYRHEAETTRLLSLAPRRRAGRPTLARALRSAARRLAGYADRLEPTPVRPAWHGRSAVRNVN
jgi:hypothetical protein